mmetsp:Transcript_8489/g.22347  ORF Transcript_8489/g.22347 Transcript_8489/m.22347 type:complete len:88 (-) Transcript_8489:805-1068(-)
MHRTEMRFEMSLGAERESAAVMCASVRAVVVVYRALMPRERLKKVKSFCRTLRRKICPHSHFSAHGWRSLRLLAWPPYLAVQSKRAQ